MAKKPTSKKTPDLPGITGVGIAPLVIPAIEKAADKYETKKNKRCEASPGEIATKGELKEALHANREKLPINADGQRFYRYEGVDYILEETLKRKKADTDEDGGEE